MKARNSIFVGLGGSIGAAGRYWIANYFQVGLTLAGTFIVNMIGCFIIGFLFEWLKKKKKQEVLWLVLGTGFCGGFTTMSAFTGELVLLWQSKQFVLSGGYLLVTWILGLFFTFVGMKIALFFPWKEAN